MKKISMKRVLLIGLAMLMLLSLAACFGRGGDDETEAEEPAAEEPAEAPAEEAEEPEAEEPEAEEPEAEEAEESEEAAAEESAESDGEEAAAADGDTTIVVSMKGPGGGNPFWASVELGAMEKAAELGVNVVVVAPPAESDVASQIAQIEDQLVQGADAIVIAPTDPEAVNPVLEQAEADGVPVLFIDTQGSLEGATFIGTNNMEGAKLAANYICENVAEGSDVAILQGILTQSTGQQRSEGGEAGLTECGLNVVAMQPGNWDRAEGQSVMENILTANPNLAGVFASNDNMALGAAEALKAAEVLEDIVLVGFDANPDAAASILAGEMSATIAQNPYNMGAFGVENALALINGETIDANIDTGTVLVDASNADQYGTLAPSEEQAAAEEGDAEEGDAEEGDAEEGDAEEGDAEEGDAEEGDAEEGDAEEGDAEEGDAEEGADSEGSDAGAAAGAAAGSDGESSEMDLSDVTIMVGMKGPGGGNPFWAAVEQGAMDKGEEMGANVIVLSPPAESDVAAQINQVEDQIASGVDAIVIAVTDPAALQPILSLAAGEGIPVLCIDTQCNAEGALTYIGTDNEVGASIAAQYICDNVEAGSDVAILQGIITQSTGQQRAEGSKAGFEACGLNVVAEQPANWDRAEGQTVMENILTANPFLSAVFASNDNMALGAIEALKSADMLDEVTVVGFDANPDAATSVLAGEMSATVAQNPYNMGAFGVENAIKALMGEEIDEVIDTGTVLVTEENAADFE